MIKRIEIDSEYADILSELVLDSNFNWYWNDGTLEQNQKTYKSSNICVIDSKTKDIPQFSHSVLLGSDVMSPHYHFFTEMVRHIEPHIGKVKRIVRIKLNLITKDSGYLAGFYNAPHIDYIGDNILSFIYYVNDSDGDTIIFDEHLDGNPHNLTELTEVDRQTPKAGTGIVFNSQRLHTSSTSRFTDRRVVVNYVFEMYETNNTKL
jgi:hypothetical protein